MEKEDITTLERVTSKYKLRYDIMEVSYAEEILGTKLYLAINITQLLNDMDLFRQTLVDTSNFELHCSISIMNLFAHYKHFYLSRAEVNRCTIIGFVKDSFTYKKYAEICDNVVGICEFFKDVYFIPDVYEYLHTHIVCACIQHMDSYTAYKRDMPRTIHVLSAYNIDKQIMTCIPTKTAHKFHKKMSGNMEDISKDTMMRELFKTEGYYRNSEYKYELDSLLVPIGKFLNSMVCTTGKSEDYTVKYTVQRVKDKLTYIDDFIKNCYKPGSDSISSQFFGYLKEKSLFKDSFVDENNYLRYLKRCDFRFKNIGVLNSALAPLVETWKKKIKDYAIARESERYKLLIKHELYADWL